jgi:hypothetical protein
MGKFPLIEMPTKKIDLINDNIIVAGTGQVDLGQRFKYLKDIKIKLTSIPIEVNII